MKITSRNKFKKLVRGHLLPFQFNWLDIIYTYYLINEPHLLEDLTIEFTLKLLNNFEQSFNYIDNQVSQNNPNIAAVLVDHRQGLVFYLKIKEFKINKTGIT